MLKVSAPLVGELEKKYLCQAINEDEISSSGRFVQRFEESFAAWSGNKYAVAVCNGTAALECAIWALGLKQIAIPNYTIISCALAAMRAGALPKFYEGKITASAIMRCHLFGCFNDEVSAPVMVDDCSQYWKPFRVWDVATYSLYANKLITCGEGGILVTNKFDIYDRVRNYRDLCRTEDRFIHHAFGYNFRMSNLQAAVALAQLENIDKHIEIKQHNRDLYLKYLPDGVEAQFNVEVPWMYIIKTPSDAGTIVRRMGEKGIECRRHFYPLHRQPCFERYMALRQGEFYISDDLWDHCFYLPSGLTLKESDVQSVCEALRQVLSEQTV